VLCSQLFASHEILLLQENPIWNDKTGSKDVRDPDAYSSKEQGERSQDKSTVADERLSGCLHIQDLALSGSSLSPRSTKRDGGIEQLRLRFLGLTNCRHFQRSMRAALGIED